MTHNWKGAARRSATLAGTVALLIAATGQGAAAGTPGGDGGAAECPESPARPVEALEPVEIGQGAMMALAPSEDQKWVPFLEGDWENAWTFMGWEFQYGGIDLDPDSIGFGDLRIWSEDGQVEPRVVLIGTWQIDCGPSKIEITIGDEVHEAGLLELSDRPGWGTYFFDPETLGVPEYIVTAYGPDGEVFDEWDLTGPPEGHGGPTAAERAAGLTVKSAR